MTSPSAADSFNPSQSPSYAFTPPPEPSPNLRTLLAYIHALNTWDYDACMAVFDEQLEHRILPKSLGRPVLNKKQYGEYFRGIMPIFKGIKSTSADHLSMQFTIHEVIEAGDKMTIHMSARGESTKGTPYLNEYILVLHFTPPGPTGEPKIRIAKEFVDSAGSIKFYTDDTQAKAKAKEGHS